MALKDKIILITGASSGIGSACAKQFAAAGAHLLLCARRIDALKPLASELQRDFGVEVYPFAVDVCQHAQVKVALETLPPYWKAVDILINNAGLAAGLDSIQDGVIQDWEDMIDTNVKGLLYMTRETLPVMVSRNTGHIINIGSIAGHQVYPKGAVYSATKHAVHALSQGLRMDLLGTKIRVSSVDPGAVETNFSVVRFKGDRGRAAEVYKGMTPLQANDVADAVVYCATRPAHVNISEMIVMSTDQASATMTFRHLE